MLRVTVNRVRATDSVQIDEVMIGRLAGPGQHGDSATRVFEPPFPVGANVGVTLKLKML